MSAFPGLLWKSHLCIWSPFYRRVACYSLTLPGFPQYWYVGKPPTSFAGLHLTVHQTWGPPRSTPSPLAVVSVGPCWPAAPGPYNMEPISHLDFGYCSRWWDEDHNRRASFRGRNGRKNWNFDWRLQQPEGGRHPELRRQGTLWIWGWTEWPEAL